MKEVYTHVETSKSSLSYFHLQNKWKYSNITYKEFYFLGTIDVFALVPLFCPLDYSQLRFFSKYNGSPSLLTFPLAALFLPCRLFFLVGFLPCGLSLSVGPAWRTPIPSPKLCSNIFWDKCMTPSSFLWSFFISSLPREPTLVFSEDFLLTLSLSLTLLHLLIYLLYPLNQGHWQPGMVSSSSFYPSQCLTHSQHAIKCFSINNGMIIESSQKIKTSIHLTSHKQFFL